MVSGRDSLTTISAAEAAIDGEGDDESRAEAASDTMRSVSEPTEGVPAFLAKLWKLVDEPRSNHLIAWAQGGNTFVIKNQIDFARKLLPLYYKHNNMASFIRQLNMYGFHKVLSVDTGSLKCENEEIQFSHPCFLKGHPYLLQHIKRKIANTKNTISNEDKALFKPELMTKVLTDVKQMKGRQESLDSRFSVMKHENEALWREVALLRQKHLKQQQIVNNLIQFLMSLVQNSRNTLKTGVKRRYQLMINNAAHNSGEDYGKGSKSPRVDSDLEDEDNDFALSDVIPDDGPIIHEVADHDHYSESTGSNILLNVRRDSQATSSPLGAVSTADSPATSIIPEVFDVVDDIDEAGASVDSPNQLIGETIDPKTLLEEISMQSDIKQSKRAKASNGKHIASKENPNSSLFSIIPTQSSVAMPSNIFDSDEANSQDDITISLPNIDEQTALSALQQDSELLGDDCMNNVVSGNYNPNINLNSVNVLSKNKTKSKNGKSKDNLIQNIKEEHLGLDDETDLDTMTLAPFNNENSRPVLARFHSVPMRDYTTHQSSERKTRMYAGTSHNEDVDGHLISMQNDIENLRELLAGDVCSIDANTLLGLFSQEDPYYGLSINPADMSLDRSKENFDESGNQLISYVPPPPNLGFEDFEDLADNIDLQSPPMLSPEMESSLNTPQVQMPEPKFPSD